VISGVSPAADIGPLAPGEIEAAAEALAQAFRDNPLNVAVIGARDPERRLRSNRVGSLNLLEVASEHGQVWVARVDGRVVGALIGTPPGGHPLPPPSLGRRLQALRAQGWQVARRWADVFEALDGVHPREPHWYLGTLGIEPRDQGCGFGAALLSAWLHHTEREPLLAYLETDREQNLRFYERAGFSVVFRTSVLGVPVWCMERPA